MQLVVSKRNALAVSDMNASRGKQAAHNCVVQLLIPYIMVYMPSTPPYLLLAQFLAPYMLMVLSRCLASGGSRSLGQGQG